MKIIYHYIREADVASALTNKAFGEGPLLSVINFLEKEKIGLVKCKLFNDEGFYNEAYISTINKAIFRKEYDFLKKVKEDKNYFLKRERLFITEFFKKNINCEVEFVLLERPEDSDEFHPGFFDDVVRESVVNEVYVVHDTTGVITSNFFAHELKGFKNIKVVCNKNDFPNGIPENFDFSIDILGTHSSSVQSFVKNVYLIKDRSHIPEEFSDLITSDKRMISLIQYAKFISNFDDNVILLGNTGTGKEVFAKAIHNASKRKDGPFIAVNCSAIPKELFESELFGSVKGAYTGAVDRIGSIEIANNGTLFLDEIGDTRFEHQTKLLRAIQEKEITKVGSTETIKVDFRLICATNKDLINVLDKEFRSDLYYRINQVSIKLPDLKDRDKKDIKELLNYFLEIEKKEHPGFENIKYTNFVINFLLDYNWPGNVRELSGFVQKAFLWACYESKNIDAEIMHRCLESNMNIEQKSDLNRVKIEDELEEDNSKDKYKNLFKVELFEGFKLDEFFEIIKKDYLIEALKINSNKTEAGKLLGYSQPSISRLKKDFNIK